MSGGPASLFHPKTPEGPNIPAGRWTERAVRPLATNVLPFDRHGAARRGGCHRATRAGEDGAAPPLVTVRCMDE